MLQSNHSYGEMAFVAEEAKIHWLIWVVGYDQRSFRTSFRTFDCQDPVNWRAVLVES
jgi:hypothetical protein